MMEQTPLSPIFWNKVLGGGTPGPTPSGTISITENGTYDVAQYAEAEVETDEFGVIASGTYTQATDTSSMTIPISFVGNPIFYVVKGPFLESTAQTGMWLFARYDLATNIYPKTFPYNTRFNSNCYKSSGAQNWANQPNNVISVTDSEITCKQRDGNYPVRAGEYYWEIWGVKQ